LCGEIPGAAVYRSICRRELQAAFGGRMAGGQQWDGGATLVVAEVAMRGVAGEWGLLMTRFVTVVRD